MIVRAFVEVTLLSNGIPYSALEEADDDQVVLWFVAVQEQQKDVMRALGV